MGDPYLEFLGMAREEASGMVPLHFCLGQILEISPGHILVKADGHELDEEDIMINDLLRCDFEEEAEITMEEDLELSGKLMGLSSPCPNGSHSFFRVDSIDNGKIHDKTAKYKVKFRLKAGDIVLLIPDLDRQTYYLVMKVVSLSESVSAD